MLSTIGGHHAGGWHGPYWHGWQGWQWEERGRWWFWHGTLWCQHAPEITEALQVRLRGSRSEPSVQVPSIPEQEPLHEVQV